MKILILVLKKDQYKVLKILLVQKGMYICNRTGEMAEWSNAAVLKTVEGHTSGGSNPSFSATIIRNPFIIRELWILCF
jgi:hypothetical protein